MTLQEWAKEKEFTASAIAAGLGVHQSTVHKYLHKKRIPDGRMMFKIRKLTRGRVDLVDWFPE